MSGFNPDITSHGNYKCPYCNHKVWKRNPSAAEKHINENHFDKATRANGKLKIERLEREKTTLENKLKAYATPPSPKKEYYDAHVFCTKRYKRTIRYKCLNGHRFDRLSNVEKDLLTKGAKEVAL